MNKHDLRVKRTRLSLEKSLLKLLRKKSLRKIQISDLADDAMVSRQTFYKHYYSLEELFISASGNFFIELNKRIQQHLLQQEQPTQTEILRYVLEQYFEEIETIKLLFTVKDKDIVMNSLREAIHMMLGSVVRDVKFHNKEIETDLLSGVIYVVLRIWVNQKIHAPVDEVLMSLTNLFENMNE